MAKNYSKQFMGWATGSKGNIFLWARLKLTLLYVAFIALILAVFSVSLYVNINKNVRDTVYNKIKEKDARQLAIEETDTKIKNEFIIGNTILLFVSAGLAFFLVTKNLRPIQEAMRKQNRFTADASHDLRTPLAIMKTDCEVHLRKPNVTLEEYRTLVESNLEEVNRMSAMVEQLLVLSRNIEMPKQAMVPVALGKVVQNIGREFQNLAAEKNITLTSSVTTDGTIRGNQLDVERMLLNILKNALTYTPPGGHIEMTVKSDDRTVQLTVKDTGIGISAENLPHITEAFYKVDEVRGQESDGSGLGLSIVQAIINNHHGKLTIHSQLGVGTEVSVLFPAFR